MTYIRKELYLLKDFDFKIDIKKKKEVKPQDKFLIVIDVVNNDNGIFCLTTSLKGEISSTYKPLLVNNCNPLKDMHFFKFSDNKICANFNFNTQTYVNGVPSNVFEDSIVTLYQKYNNTGKAKNMGLITKEHFLSLLSCLCQSKFLSRELKARLQQIGEEESLS